MTRAIDETEAKKLWNEQIANAPKTETKTERMLVGVILPIWDRVEGAEIIIAGDNDLHQELTEGRNPGKEKAEAAATAVGGVALFPIFAPGEQAYPMDLDPVTPALAKGDGLSDAQKEAISKMKSFTDFNDLATKSVLGWEGVERQITNVVNKIVSDQRERIETRQHQDNVQRLELQQRQKLASRNAVAII